MNLLENAMEIAVYYGTEKTKIGLLNYDEKKQNTNPAADVVRKCMDQKSSLWIIRDRYDKDFKVEKVYEV